MQSRLPLRWLRLPSSFISTYRKLLNKSLSQFRSGPTGRMVFCSTLTQDCAALVLHPANEDLFAGAPAWAILTSPSGRNVGRLFHSIAGRQRRWGTQKKLLFVQVIDFNEMALKTNFAPALRDGTPRRQYLPRGALRFPWAIFTISLRERDFDEWGTAFCLG